MCIVYILVCSIRASVWSVGYKLLITETLCLVACSLLDFLCLRLDKNVRQSSSFSFSFSLALVLIISLSTSRYLSCICE